MKTFFIFMCCFLFAATGFALEFHVDTAAKNSIKFTSDASIEKFAGVTNKIDGYIRWEGEDPLKNSDFYFEVQLNTLDTGIGLRNRHMREYYLETDNFPTAHFTGKLVKIDKKIDQTYLVLVSGKMSIHGIEKMMDVEGTVTVQDEGLHLNSSFKVLLSDYKIKIPQLMFMKISDTMPIDLDVFLKEYKNK